MKETPSKDRRYTLLRKVVYSVSLPLVTRLVYVVLDDHCGAKGRCWYKQQSMATKLGISVRQFQRALAELQDRGALRVERNSKYLVYILAWSDATPVSYQCCDTGVVSEATPVSYHSAPHLITDPQFLIRGENPQSKPPVTCALCEDSGVTGTTAENVAICECAAGDAMRRSA